MHSKLILFLITFLSIGTKLIGQNIEPHEENIVLFTDRMIYVSGEKVSFVAYTHSTINSKQTDLSKIFYSELIDYDGRKIVGNKFVINNSFGQGDLTIPEEMISGNYFIRAYTKYMRNYEPEYYSYIPIKIVNPSNNSILEGNDLKTDLELNNKDIDTVKFAKLRVNTNKMVFATREEVKFTISNKDNFINSLKGYCITIVPKASLSSRLIPIKKNFSSSKLHFYPETRGLSLTGKLIDKTTKTHIPYNTVNLSIIGNNKVFMSYVTDSVGRFYFALPKIYGERDIFLSVDNIKKTGTNVLVDNDFCTQSIKLPSNSIRLTEAEEEIAYNFSVNQQIRSHYNTENFEIENKVEDEYTPFYGKPSETLILDKYIKLPTLQEYFTELPSSVKVRKRNGKKYLKIYSDLPIMSIYPPLILIDGLAIGDPERILEISPQKISRVEIVTKPYIKGDLTYGGIISLISKKGDFAGVNLPESGIFINYSFLASKPEIKIKNPNKSNIPDTRNTLYWTWNNKLHETSENARNYSFYTSDTPGTYTILIRGMTKKGTTFECSTDFEVRD